jgi:uncharacterized membrane protein YhdT
MMPATPGRRIALKLALATALLALVVAARLPFIGNILAGEEGYFAALVLNSTPISALDDRHLPREIAGFIDGKPILQTFHRTVMPYVVMEIFGRAVAARNVLGRLSPERLTVAARWPFAFMFLLGSLGLIALTVEAAASAGKRMSASGALVPLAVTVWSLTSPLAVSASIQPQVDGSVGVLLLGTAATLLALSDIKHPAALWRFLMAGMLAGLGKHEWALAFAAAAVGAALICMIDASGRRRNGAAFVVFLIGLALAVALSYAISPDDYRAGFNVMTNIFERTGGELWALQSAQWPFSVPVVALVLVDGAFIMVVLRRLIRTAPGLLLAYMAAVAIVIGYAASGWHGDNFPRYFAPPFVILPLVFAALWLRFKDVVTPAAGWSVLAAAVIGLWANYQFLAASHDSQVALGDLRGEPLAQIERDYAAAAKLGHATNGVVFTVTTTWIYHQGINFISTGLGKDGAADYIATHFPAFRNRLVFPPD